MAGITYNIGIQCESDPALLGGFVPVGAFAVRARPASAEDLIELRAVYSRFDATREVKSWSSFGASKSLILRDLELVRKSGSAGVRRVISECFEMLAQVKKT